MLNFHGLSPPGSPPSCPSLHRSPASGFPATLPGSQNHRTPLIDVSLNLVFLLASRGALRFPSSLSPSSLPAAWTTQATDACFWVRTRCWAELSSCQVGQASDDRFSLTHRLPTVQRAGQAERGAKQPLFCLLLQLGPDHGRGGGGGEAEGSCGWRPRPTEACTASV